MEEVKTNNYDIAVPDGISVISREGKIIAFNDAASRITGYKEKDVILKNYKLLFQQSAEYAKYINNALTKGETFSNFTLNISCPDNRILSVLASIYPIQKANNDIVSVVFIFRDTKEMYALTSALQKKIQEAINEKNKFESIFNGVSEGIFTIDNHWNITSFNRAAEKITGYTNAEAVGRKCWDIFKSSVCRKGCHMETSLADNRLMLDNELVISAKTGKRISIRVNSQPFFNADGKCVGGVETFRDVSEIKNLATHLQERYGFEKMIGHSHSMQKIYDLLQNVSQSDSTVLITGESGTGKELVARAIHLNSERRSKPFMAVNCSAFVENLLESELFGHEKGAFTGAVHTKQGRFELAQGGTLFLDEIGDISLQVQVKLLRVLETQQFERVGGTKPVKMDVRIIAATNKDLNKEIQENRFREDFFYRINVVNIHLPPLRDRMDDLPLLVEHFLKKFRNKFKKDINTISSEAFTILRNYSWPGNIRELENVLEHTFVICKGNNIKQDCLPEWLLNYSKNDLKSTASYPVQETIKNAEKIHIQSVLNQFGGRRGKAAEALGIDKSTLWRKMKKFGLLA